MEALIQRLLNFDHWHCSDQRWGMQKKYYPAYVKIKLQVSTCIFLTQVTKITHITNLRKERG